MSFPGTFAPTLFASSSIFENELSTFFDGVNDRIEMQDTASLNIANDLTMVCWVKSSGTTDASFMSKYKTSGNHRQYLIGQTAAGGLRVLISRDGGSTNVKDYNSTETINDNNWHMVATTFATNVLKLYIDGVEITPNKVADPVANQMPGGNISAFQMSSIEGVPTLFRYAGFLDECGIWATQVLTSAEILKLYNSGSPINLLVNDGAYVSSGNLEAYYRMGDGDSSTTIFDAKSGSDGTLVSMDETSYVTEVPS